MEKNLLKLAEKEILKNLKNIEFLVENISTNKSEGTNIFIGEFP